MGLLVRLAPGLVIPDRDDGSRWFRLHLENRSAKMARGFGLTVSAIRPWPPANFEPIRLMSAVNIEPDELGPGGSWPFDFCHSSCRDGFWMLHVGNRQLPAGAYE